MRERLSISPKPRSSISSKSIGWKLPHRTHFLLDLSTTGYFGEIAIISSSQFGQSSSVDQNISSSLRVAAADPGSGPCSASVGKEARRCAMVRRFQKATAVAPRRADPTTRNAVVQRPLADSLGSGTISCGPNSLWLSISTPRNCRIPKTAVIQFRVCHSSHKTSYFPVKSTRKATMRHIYACGINHQLYEFWDYCL